MTPPDIPIDPIAILSVLQADYPVTYDACLSKAGFMKAMEIMADKDKEIAALTSGSNASDPDGA